MNILVTGCSRGLGLEICRVLLREGHVVYGVARSYTDDFKALELENKGKLFFKSIDLSDSENVRKSVFKEYISNDIVLHGFVNNAAIAYDDIVTNLKLDRLKAMYEVNVFTPMIITKYAIRNMLLHKTKGGIVHISSISVHTGYKGLAMYASSKGALEAFSKDIAREWGFMGIRSNKEVTTARRVGITWMIVSYIGTFIIGTLGTAYLLPNVLSGGVCSHLPERCYICQLGCRGSGILDLRQSL